MRSSLFLATGGEGAAARAAPTRCGFAVVHCSRQVVLRNGTQAVPY